MISASRADVLLLAEEVLVQPLELDGAITADADAVFDHQVGQLLPVDEDHSLGQMLDVVARRLAEGGGGDEDALGGAEADETSDKAVHIRAAHRIAGCVALGLDIDAVEAEAILVDDAIDAAVTGTAPSWAAASLWLPP